MSEHKHEWSVVEYIIQCENEGCTGVYGGVGHGLCGDVMVGGINKDEVIAAWNRRANGA